MGLLENTMAAFTQPNPADSRKTPTQAKTSGRNKYGRDSSSPSERLRVSDYTQKDCAPYVPLPFSFLADIPRLTSGNPCTLLLMVLWSKSAGRGTKKNEPRPEWTIALSTSDLAQICRCDIRTIEREIVGLEKRGLAEIKRPTKGRVEVRLLYREWEALPDFKSQVVEMPPPETPPEETPPDDPSPTPGSQRVTGKRPIRMAQGALSKVFPVTTGVKSLQFRRDGPRDCPIDLDFSCVIQAGELLIKTTVPDDWRQKLDVHFSRSNESSKLQETPRHVRRGEHSNHVTVDHPRATELTTLFDPLLGKSGAKLLSMDSSALRSACEAVMDCDHEYLTKFAINRASSPITNPRHVKLICKEALAAWKASKTPGVIHRDHSERRRKKTFAEGVLEDIYGKLARGEKV
jgi:hypothetical protein